MIAQHLSNSQEHHTPELVVELSRKVLVAIDLDPASCREANRTVKAERFFGLPKDGLAMPWEGRVFLNPPGGSFVPKRQRDANGKLPKKKLTMSAADKAHALQWGTKSRAVAWWRKLVVEHECGHVPAAIFVGFNLDILQASQAPGRKSAMDFPYCIPRERLCFGGDDPTHGNVLVYLGPKRELFRKVFSELGAVKL